MINKTPNDLNEALKEYLHNEEKVLDSIEEVYVLNFDFRWILLTNKRIVVAIKRFLDYNFKDYSLDTLDIDIDLGFFFDTLGFRIPSKTYTAHFYRFNRYDTLKFFHEIERKMNQENGTKKNGKENGETTKKLKELKNLYNDGIITERDFKRKKKDILDKL